MTSALYLYNSIHRKKEPFQPIAPPRVGMYVCGVTAYDYCHIGHARVMVVFDVISRWLRHSGYQLTYVRNITDIDDKIIRRAAENGEHIDALTTRFIEAMHEDERALGVLAPDNEPRATEHITPMINMIEKLLQQGFAYRTANGDICFAVRQFAHYGRLSGKTLDELRIGERVDLDSSKHDPLDFVLWKAAKPDDPQWPAPFGAGRPGWHIECSAMSQAHLGEYFDIHGGGQDLQFPHHDNEIAQSEAANQGAFVKVWLHNGFVTIDREKMAKSSGNFRTIRDVLQEWPAEVLRFLLLRSHYRSPLHFSDNALADAKSALTRLYQCLRGKEADFLGIDQNDTAIDWDYPEAAAFKAAMDDDVNTPMALAVLFELVKKINRQYDKKAIIMLYLLSGVLGLLQQDPHMYFTQPNMDKPMEQALSDSRIEELIQERNLYRNSQNFVEADRIREELMEGGVILDDSPAGTTWKRL